MQSIKGADYKKTTKKLLTNTNSRDYNVSVIRRGQVYNERGR